MKILLETQLPFPIFRRGKVRDVYDLGDQLLLVATDRISAFDCVMAQGIPGKGRILTQVANFWFKATEDLIPNHLLVTRMTDYPQELQSFGEYLAGRSVLVQKARALPVECVVRGYLAGSGWKDYQESGKLFGRDLPKSLRLGDRLPKPVFTPTSKAETGHDEPMSLHQVENLVGLDLAARLEELSLALYARGSTLAQERGILLADTKFEFGLDAQGRLLLIDEALTPDSSRYWLEESWQPGTNPPSLDKQFLRDYLESLPHWNKQAPPPDLPESVIQGIQQRYEDLAGRFGLAKI